MPAHEAMPRLRTEARNALDIDPSLPEAHAMLGMVAAMYDFDWGEAERQFRLALANDAAPAQVHRYYAHYCLMPVGRAGEAVDQGAINLREDPLNLAARAEYSVSLRAAGRKADGDDELRHVLELDATFWFPYFMLAVNHALDGNFEDALMRAEQGYRAAPWFTPVAGALAALLERSGETSRAEALRRTLWPEKGDGDPIAPAIYHLLRGDLESVADWTEKAIELRQPAVLFFVNGHATALRSSPRWPALARLMNLPETS
jgi:tetratricopeptide (TPR) repeat protein